MTIRDNTALPPGWISVVLNDLAANEPHAVTDGPFGSNLKTSHYTDAGPRVLRLQNIGDGVFVDALAHISREHFERLTKHRIYAGDLVIAALGETLPRSCVIPPSVGPAIVKADCIRFKPDAELTSSKYLNFALNSETVRARTATIVHGIGRPRLNLGEVKAVEVPLAPLAEQQRIVAAIEERFSRLDTAVAGLKRVQQLKRYRASVLKAACEGRLVPTEAELARAEGHTYEPAAQLLARILEERRARWEAEQMAKMRTAGKPPKGDGWKAKYEEPPSLSDVQPVSQPEGWTWATVEQLICRSEYGTSVKCSHDSEGPPVLRIPNVAAGHVLLHDVKFATVPLNLKANDVLLGGDVLMVRTNGSVNLVGRTAVVPENQTHSFYFASYLLRFRLAESTKLPRWFSLYATSNQGRRFLEGSAASSAGQHNVSLSLIHRWIIPLPPLAEQQRIVAEVERRLSVIEKAEAVVAANLKRAAQMRQAILKQAFEGKLVPQDPTDEPASMLLERIRAEREAAAEKSPKRRGRPSVHKDVEAAARRNGQLSLLDDDPAETTPLGTSRRDA